MDNGGDRCGYSSLELKNDGTGSITAGGKYFSEYYIHYRKG